MSISFRMLTLIGFLSIAALGVPTAQAALFVNGTGACLDVQFENTANFTPVQAYFCNATFAQQWNYEGLAIQGVGTTGAGGKCLDVYFAGTAAGTKVELYQCNGTGAQTWYFYNGQLINTHSDMCLDVGSGAAWTQAYINSCNGGASQQWHIRS